MRKQTFTLAFILFYLLGFSQKNESVYPNFIDQKLNTFDNNSNWKILQKSTGDINNDGLIDFALVIESKDSIIETRRAKLVKNKPRIILVFLNQNEEGKVIIQNNVFIARGDEGGMLPYLEPQLSIKDGLLDIYYEYTRSNVSFTFQFNDYRMENIKARVVYVDDGFTMDEYDFKKGEVIRTIENEEEDSIEKTNFNLKPKILSEYKEMGTWELLKDRRL